MTGAALLTLALLCVDPERPADLVTLKSGYTIEGHVEDPASDPIVVVMPKGRIALYQDMIESVALGAAETDTDVAPNSVEGAEAEGADEPEAIPTINLRPNLDKPEDVEIFINQVTGELERLLLRPEETEAGEEQLQPVYVQALGELGPGVAGELEELLRKAPPQMGEPLLQALAQAAPEQAAGVASEFATTLEHPKAREAAVKLVGNSDLPDRDAVLDKAAADSVWYVRAAAYRAMVNPEELATLMRVAAGLSDSDADVQAEVRAILKEKTGQDLQTPEAVQQWIASQEPIEATVVEQP